MKAHLIDTHLLVPRSRSSAKVKVKYQGHVFQEMGVSGALVFHKHILFIILNKCRVFIQDPYYVIPTVVCPYVCLSECLSISNFLYAQPLQQFPSELFGIFQEV